MEKEKIIKSYDSKDICGTLSESLVKTKRIIIFVHGFTGNNNEHIFFNGAKFFAGKGFDTYRMSLYGTETNNSRHFKDTKISQHGKDITTVVEYFRNTYEKIYIVGHSYGGTSLLFVNPTYVDGYIFWDASYISPNDSQEDIKFNNNLDRYIMDWGIEILVGKDYINELKNFPDCGELIKKINKPVLFITAGKRGGADNGIKYFKNANNPKKLVNIETADHNFNNWSDEERLFNETSNWINE